ncbi:hypothetical protein TgHK011_006229 [Trichoderma gracile]|nr:hypothetical protein TgHK011_006229 [Trichoderma gracile]
MQPCKQALQPPLLTRYGHSLAHHPIVPSYVHSNASLAIHPPSRPLLLLLPSQAGCLVAHWWAHILLGAFKGCSPPASYCSSLSACPSRAYSSLYTIMAARGTGDAWLPSSLEAARIAALPSTAYYLPNFISEEEERLILDKIAAAPRPRWKQLTHRRLQTWPSDLVNNKLLDAPLPSWLETPIVPRLLSLPLSDDGHSPKHIFAESPHQRPNHVLINEYPPGIGIMPHKMALRIGPCKEDGALDPEPAWRILQEPRSLLITTANLYTDYLHGIADTEEDLDLSADTIVNWPLLRDPEAFAHGRNPRQTRTSLTYRDVLQVSKVGAKLGLFGKR